ncbi:MAG: peptidoglycan DD-metalloendopeptidase family protein [Hylemonella sp.]
MSVCLKRLLIASFCLILFSVQVACTSTSINRAPVEDRGTANTRPAAAVASRPAPAPLPDSAVKPGYYAVKPGDTLIRIGLESGQNWREIARWNNIENPNQIEVGQVLRVVPPQAPAAPAAAAQTAVVTRPVAPSNVQTQAVPPPSSAAAPHAAPPAAPDAAPVTEDSLAWAWPVNGPVLTGFDEVKNKGLDLGGAAGDPVLAAADGRVVYAGAGLRGYGNLIIVKHNNTYLTAYAHNQALLVKEDQAVRKGQKIAEMGSSDTDRVKLHFEVRRQGKPVDPVKYLPNR